MANAETIDTVLVKKNVSVKKWIEMCSLFLLEIITSGLLKMTCEISTRWAYGDYDVTLNILEAIFIFREKYNTLCFHVWLTFHQGTINRVYLESCNAAPKCIIGRMITVNTEELSRPESDSRGLSSKKFLLPTPSISSVFIYEQHSWICFRSKKGTWGWWNCSHD